jgi:hypothetical protein
VQVGDKTVLFHHLIIGNSQIGYTPLNLWIGDYSHGLTGSAHDATAFQHTAAVKHPDLLFDDEEIAWADSAYAIST